MRPPISWDANVHIYLRAVKQNIPLANIADKQQGGVQPNISLANICRLAPAPVGGDIWEIVCGKSPDQDHL